MSGRPLKSWHYYKKILTGFPLTSSLGKTLGVQPVGNFTRRNTVRSLLTYLFNMPHANGDSKPNGASKDVLDFTAALDVLEKEYTERDGIDVQTLLDSKTNGGLTYNDFLVMPGYIGETYSHSCLGANSNRMLQASQLLS